VLDRSANRVPDDVRAVLYRALARDRALRYPTAAAFAEAIEEILRRRRLQVGPAKLAAWIEKLGLVEVEAADSEQSETSVRKTANISAPASTPGPPSPVEAQRRPTVPPGRVASQQSSEPRDVAPSIYRVKMPGGPAMGPLSYPRLVELFVTGG